MTTITVNDVRTRLQSRRRIRGVAVGLLFLFVVGLTSAWVYQLAFRPRLTPLFAATVTDYGWPVDPNAWAQEDLARLSSLHQQSLRLVDLSADWRSRELALRRLDNDLTLLTESRQRTDTVVFYFSLHGVVDSQGQPHLLPADASPLDSATWLPVSEIVGLINRKLPPTTHKLVLLDSNRSAANWRIGMLHNTFADRLTSVIDPQTHPNTVIVNSTSPDQVGWSSPALAGSLFGYLVGRGLGGEGRGPSGQVTLAGLVEFVNREMSRWCTNYRLPPQRVSQIPATAEDFAITWPLAASTLGRLFDQDKPPEPPATTPIERDALWRQAGELPRRSLLSVAPETLNDIEHQLLWLERLSIAGAAYDRRAELQSASIRRRLATVTDVMTADESRASPLAIHSVLAKSGGSSGNGSQFQGAVIPSLRLATTLGGVPADAAESAARKWAELVAGVAPEQLEQTIRLFDTISRPGEAELRGTMKNGPSDSRFDDAQLLRLLNRYRVVSRWPNRDPISRTLALRADADRFSVMLSADGTQELRSLAWVGPVLKQADQARMQLEDRLLAGPDAAADFDTRLDETRSAYDRVAQQLGDVSQAIATADDATHRLPYLAGALAVLMPSADASPDPGNPADSVVTRVLPAMRDAGSLARQLDRPPTSATDSASVLPFLATSTRLREAMSQLDEELDAWIKTKLAEADNSGSTLIELRAVLDLPWLPWQQRRDLRQLHDRISQSLAAPARAMAADSPDQPRSGLARRGRAETGNRTRALTTLDRILTWSVHPAVLASSGEPRGDGDGDADPLPTSTVAAESGIERVEQMGYRVRQMLANWTGDAKATPWDDPTLTSSGWLSVARWQRRSLPLVGSVPTDSPLEQVWRYRVQQTLLWHADRHLNAFLGPDRTAIDVNGVKPFFDSACDNCLELIDVVGPASEEIQARRDAVRSRQITRRLAARSGIVTSVANSPLPPAVDNPRIDVTVSPSDGATDGDQPFPVGSPSVWLRTDGGDLASDVALLALPLAEPQQVGLAPAAIATATDSANATDLPNQPSPPPAAETLPTDTPPPPPPTVKPSGTPPSVSPRLNALTVFRGNEFSQPFVINRLGGTLVDYRPHEYGASTITLLGERRKRASIVFVLDCSRSMEDPLAGESASLVGPSRLELAKSALVEMLDQLSRQDGTRIGVILFGHRIAWTRSDPPRLSQSPGAGVDIPDGLMPSQDVETVLPLGRFDSGRVLQRLDSVLPWGQTPLNLALIEAMRAFENDDADTEKSIIVITDGRDYQFTPNRSDIRQPTRVTQSDVLAAAENSGVPIYLLGFGVPADERSAAESEYQTIATATGGEAIPVDVAGDLLRQMKAKLAPGSFTVGGESPQLNQAADPRSVTATLNATVKVDPQRIDGSPFRLSFESLSLPIPLAGGEALQIRLSPDGREFLPIPFDWQFPSVTPLVDGNGRPTPYQFRAHRPQRQGPDVRFPVSVQSTRDAVTPRPTESWLTVTPIVDGSELTAHQYHFFDTNYEPQQPVPLLEWDARQWPAESQSARLDFWCKFEPTSPIAEFPIGAVIDRSDDFSDLALADFPSIRLQISVSDRSAGDERYVVNVIQRHTSPNADLGQVKLDFQTAKAFRPLRVTHRFDPEHGVASHTFTFRAADAAGIERSQQSRIVVVARDAARSGALSPAGGQGVRVDLYSPSDVISLSPPR